MGGGTPPLRVVYVEERELSGRRAGTVHRILAGTDLSAKQAPLETLRRLVHVRWGRAVKHFIWDTS